MKQGITSFWGLFFPFGIILGMRFGMFTPSEGGAVAVLYCIIIGRFVYKKLSLKEHLVPILLDSIAGTSSVVLIMVAANVFGYYMTWINLPRVVATGMLSLTTNKWLFLYSVQRDPSDYGYVPGRRRGANDHHTSAASGCKTAWNQ
ncbi:MAG: TRAP transporter large permease subunit [Clostridium fessum]